MLELEAWRRKPRGNRAFLDQRNATSSTSITNIETIGCIWHAHLPQKGERKSERRRQYMNVISLQCKPPTHDLKFFPTAKNAKKWDRNGTETVSLVNFFFRYRINEIINCYSKSSRVRVHIHIYIYINILM